MYASTILSLLVSTALALPKSHGGKRTTYPFANIVAFGDEFSDNGNGSYAHGITGNPATVYGFGTWTNGPVAVSYLNDLLGLGSTGLNNFAYGGCCGGSSFGATLDTAYTPSPAKSPSLVDQLANYTASGNPKIQNSLGFVWVGQNDLSKHTDAFWGGDPQNSQFASNFSSKTSAAVSKLLNAGAPYVLVANIYPKHLAPVTPAYLCGTSTSCVQTWGQVIQQANSALQTSLAQFGSKVIYYDVFGFMVNLLNNAAANGFTQPLTSFCDGDGDANWQACMVNGQGSTFFWMNWEQMTTRVHGLVAADMKKTIDSHLGL
jgi:phospholipase/lecithinase/hemolysin